MRKLIYALNLTLDGCVDHTKGIADDELHEHYAQFIRDVDLLVYGRKTYELMVPFWPDMARDHSGPTKALNEFAQAFASTPIVVFSRTLESAEGQNTRIVRAGLQDEVLKLKQEPGGNIATGGVDVPSQLIQLGLVDEYHFVIQPLVVGEGRRLLDDLRLPDKLQLRLVDSKTFASGCVALRYVKQ